MTNEMRSEAIPIGMIREQLNLPVGWKVKAIIQPDTEYGEIGTNTECHYPAVILIDNFGRQRAGLAIYQDAVSVRDLVDTLKTQLATQCERCEGQGGWMDYPDDYSVPGLAAPAVMEKACLDCGGTGRKEDDEVKAIWEAFNERKEAIND